MFADDIAHDKTILRIYRGFDKLQKLIIASQKFSLARDFAVAADGLCDNIDELLRIAPFCRLPYPITWIEFRQADRAHWLNAPTHYPIFQSKPGSLAFLCVAKDPKDLTCWTTILCWTLKDPIDKVPFNASIVAVDVNLAGTANALRRSFGLGFDPYVTAVATPFISNVNPANMPMGHVIGSDWAGEVTYLFAVLALMNARNVAEISVSDLTKLNKARVRRRKLPLYEYKILKVRAAHKASLLPPKSSDQARSGEIRGHFVKGHWKVRKSGVFFWGPHRRGGRGFVHKTYELT